MASNGRIFKVWFITKYVEENDRELYRRIAGWLTYDELQSTQKKTIVN
jgi:hypothetical protein